MDNNSSPIIETHPWKPFLPPDARVLIMGTFPPPSKRWSMDFYYPNRTNDFWFMIGLLFLGDRHALYDTLSKTFNLPAIKQLLTDKGIALSDTGHRVIRLKGNASDKFLEIVEPAPLAEILSQIPQCHAVATTGEKAAGVIAALTGTRIPGMGEMVCSPDGLTEIWRMPSTSRAYPMKLELKAEYYARMFRHAGIL